MSKKKRKASEKHAEIVSKAITESVCEQFMDWLGKRDKAPFDLRADVYARVEKIMRQGVDC